MVSVEVVAGLLIVYLIGIIGCVSGVGVGNVFRGVRRSTCRARVVVSVSDSKSESESGSLPLSMRAVGAGWLRNAGVGKYVVERLGRASLVRVERTLAREAVMWPSPVAGE